jgi:hypothetical protein
MRTINKVKTYKKENIVGLFQTSTSIAINEVQALSSRWETKKRCNKYLMLTSVKWRIIAKNKEIAKQTLQLIPKVHNFSKKITQQAWCIVD